MSSGGAATSSGIDFQHRVGAAAMLSMATDAEVLRWLWREARNEVVTEVRFETRDAIDDLVIVTDRRRYLVQAKRSLSFSTSPTSEFASVLAQFVDQFASDPDANDGYVLAASPAASGRIRVDLRKLTEAARLNELGPPVNPLTGPEEEMLENTYALIKRFFAERTGRAMSVDERDTLFARIHIAVVDLERGGSSESVMLTAIAGRSKVDPEAVWSSLVALALALAKERLSIDRRALAERVGQLFTPPADEGADELVADAAKVIVGDPVSAGREVVLAEDDEGRLFLIELIRFNEDGTRRVHFVDGYLDFPNGPRWRVLRRTSTFAGMERMLLADPSSIEGREIDLIPIESDDDADSSPWAQAHAALCEQRIQERASVLECIQCGRPISEAFPSSVEVDEEGVPHDVGLVHTACLRPTHRVTGRVSIDAFTAQPLPADFDHRAWVETRPTGQGAFNAASPVIRGQVVVLGWKPGRSHLAVGNWGVTYELEDGSVRYVRERGRVVRLTKSNAEEDARAMNAALGDAEAANNPLCVSASSGAFTTYSLLLRTEPGARALKVLSANARELTRATLIANDEVENFYAPLVGLVEADAGLPFALGNARVLLTDPLRVADSIANWERAGMTVPALNTTVIRSDDQFDSFVVSSFRSGIGVVIDPILDPEGKPVAGYLVRDVEALIENASERSET